MSGQIKVPKHIKAWMGRDKQAGLPGAKSFWVGALRAEAEANRQRHRIGIKDKSEKS